MIESHQNLATFLLNKPLRQKWMKLTMSLIKVDRKIIWIFNLKKWRWKQKIAVYDRPQSKGLTGYQQICWGCSFGCKNLLNFTYLPIRFHNSYFSHKRFGTDTGKRPFSCEICEMKFRTPSKLKRHSSIHTGEKPYSCKYCGKKYTQACHVNFHIGKSIF